MGWKQSIAAWEYAWRKESDGGGALTDERWLPDPNPSNLLIVFSALLRICIVKKNIALKNPCTKVKSNIPQEKVTQALFLSKTNRSAFQQAVKPPNKMVGTMLEELEPEGDVIDVEDCPFEKLLRLFKPLNDQLMEIKNSLNEIAKKIEITSKIVIAVQERVKT